MVTHETKREAEAPEALKTSKSFHSQATPSDTRLKRNLSSFLDYEKYESAVFEERLGKFDRISLLTFWLIFICILLGGCAYLLIEVELTDDKWQKIIAGKIRFPSLAKPLKGKSYFENTYIQGTELGRAIKSRRNWVKAGLNFGLSRPTIFDWVIIGVLALILAVCVIHLLLLCCVDWLRSNFMVISLGYGFIGLLTFGLCLSTLFYAFVHQTSSFLENAHHPPELSGNNASNISDLFRDLTIACAFAFSSPNPFANYSTTVKLDGSLRIDGYGEYDKLELMELSLCPKADFLLVAMVILCITAFLSWLVAAYSEVVENQVLGPPVWLERFKLKKVKGHRHWQQRKLGASRSHISIKSSRITFHPVMSFNDQRKWLEKRPNQEPVIEDAYNILDGGIDHIILEDTSLGVASLGTIRYYDKFYSMQHFNK